MLVQPLCDFAGGMIWRAGIAENVPRLVLIARLLGRMTMAGWLVVLGGEDAYIYYSRIGCITSTQSHIYINHSGAV